MPSAVTLRQKPWMNRALMTKSLLSEVQAILSAVLLTSLIVGSAGGTRGRRPRRRRSGSWVYRKPLTRSKDGEWGTKREITGSRMVSL